jgi:alkylation response protein AidB-like acyl-CoA dehydrogenase
MVRAIEKDTFGCTEELWNKMVALGWSGLPFPEEFGGAGGTFLDLAVLLEEMGRCLAPGPFFSTVVLGGLALLESGSETQKQELLPAICSGRICITVAVLEDGAIYNPEGIQMEARKTEGGYVLVGTKLFVPDAHLSDLIIVAARTSKRGDPGDGITLFMVDNPQDNVVVTPHLTVTADWLAEVALDGVLVSESSVLGSVGKGWPILERTLQRAAVAKCMEMLGGATVVLEMTQEYAKQRVQFGRPVGSFQAIQHHCANMAMDVEGCHNVAYQAAWSLCQGKPNVWEVSIAKAWVSDAYQRVCSLAHQCHGAIGFTEDHNLQLYTRRSKAQELAYGDTAFHREMVAKAIGM